MENCLISVIVPVYNVEKYLERCVKSILGQSYKWLEIILINDGSTDNSSQLCDFFASKNKNIKLYHQTNEGLSAARNKGIELAEGDFIAFVDSDDFLHKNYFEILKKAIDVFSSTISCCKHQKVNGDIQKDIDYNLETIQYECVNSTWCINELLRDQSFTTSWAKLYNKDVFQNIKFPNGLLFEDMYVTPNIFDMAEKISLVEIPLYYYNQEGLSITRSTFSKKKIIHFYNAINKWDELIENRYPTLISRSKTKLICDYLQLYNYAMQHKWNKKNNFRFVIRSQIYKYGRKVFFNSETRLNDKIKLIFFYSGSLKYFFQILNLFYVKNIY